MAEERQQQRAGSARPIAGLHRRRIFLALAALYFGRDIFVPFALAILLAFAVAPLVDWLRRFKVPRIAAVLLAVSLAMLIIGGVSPAVGGQLIELASSVPSYKQTISTNSSAALPRSWRGRARPFYSTCQPSTATPAAPSRNLSRAS